jgi:hypothetical protein
MTRPRPRPATCAVCDHPGVRPSEGHMIQFCHEHEEAWLCSGEHARAATARVDFVQRARAEAQNCPLPIRNAWQRPRNTASGSCGAGESGAGSVRSPERDAVHVVGPTGEHRGHQHIPPT